MVKVTIFGSGERREYVEVGQHDGVSIHQGDDLMFYCSGRLVKHVTRQDVDLLIQFNKKRLTALITRL